MPHYPNNLSPTQHLILREIDNGSILTVEKYGVYWLTLRDKRRYWQSKNAVNALIKKGLIVLKPLSSSEYVRAEEIA